MVLLSTRIADRAHSPDIVRDEGLCFGCLAMRFITRWYLRSVEHGMAAPPWQGNVACPESVGSLRCGLGQGRSRLGIRFRVRVRLR